MQTRVPCFPGLGASESLSASASPARKLPQTSLERDSSLGASRSGNPDPKLDPQIK